jgi:hypothetical protein
MDKGNIAIEGSKFWCPECETDLTDDQVDCAIDHSKGFEVGPDTEEGWTFVDYCLKCLARVEVCDDIS